MNWGYNEPPAGESAGSVQTGTEPDSVPIDQDDDWFDVFIAAYVRCCGANELEPSTDGVYAGLAACRRRFLAGAVRAGTAPEWVDQIVQGVSATLARGRIEHHKANDIAEQVWRVYEHRYGSVRTSTELGESALTGYIAPFTRAERTGRSPEVSDGS